MDMDLVRRWVDYLNIREFLYNNHPIKLLILAVLLVLLILAVKYLCSFIIKKILDHVDKYKNTDADGENKKAKLSKSLDENLFSGVVKSSKFLLYALVVFWCVNQLYFSQSFDRLISLLFITICIWAAIDFCCSFIPFNIDLYLRRHGTTLLNSQTRSLMPIVKGIIWAIGLTVLLDNVGVHVSTIIAGLGIVGVAVGLAGQAILSDFFSYIVILFDKPFKIGDFVVLSNGKSGQIVYMGPKTTRLLSLDNNLIICANTEMTKGIIENQGPIQHREVSVEVGVSFTVPMEKVRKVPEILKEVVNSVPGCTFERACMTNFGTANYLFQLIYHVVPQEGGINEFMNTQTEVNLAFTDRLNKEMIIGSYPTQTIMLSTPSPIQVTSVPPPDTAKKS